MGRSQAITLLVSFALAAPGSAGGAGFLRKTDDEVTTAEVRTSLLSELAGNVSNSRLEELEAALQPMYAALPRGENGYLGHQAVRYALHRLLLQRHGWFIVGLEPSEEARPPYLAGDWVPEYLQGLLEQRLGGRGLDLREVAALAASLEDLVRAETARRVDIVSRTLGKDEGARLDDKEADRLLETYMMMYLDEGSFSNYTLGNVDMRTALTIFKQEYADWDSAAEWMQEIKRHHASSAADGKLGRESLIGIANDLGERFGAFNDGECRSLKRVMTELEGPRPGRVPLLDFYKKGLYSHWAFNEKVEYLRALGALDETDPMRPMVILANYLGSRTNCLAASSLYAVCCRNECEDLIGSLERELAASTASPQRILTLVMKLPSDTVNASRELPTTLINRLYDIATRHGGEVPLHGRLFAQWMHHAYPRECPYPHEGGNPMTADEWLGNSWKASEEEVRELLGECAAESAGPCGPGPAAAGEGGAASDELPWTEEEVLLDAPTARREGSSSRSRVWLFLPLGVAAALLAVRAKVLPALEARDEDEIIKPGKAAVSQEQQIKMLAALAIGGLLLDFLGVLDAFTLACALCCGLLLNVALPLMIRNGASVAGVKPAKCVV